VKKQQIVRSGFVVSLVFVLSVACAMAQGAGAAAVKAPAPAVKNQPANPAAAPAKSDPVGEACKADFDKLCKGLTTAGGELQKCVKEHEAELSAGCKAAMEAQLDKAFDRHPCAPEINKLCKGLKGKARAGCVMKNNKEMTEACKARLALSKEKAPEKQPEENKPVKPEPKGK